MRTSHLRRRLAAALVVGAIAASAVASLAAAAPVAPHAPSVERWRPLVEKYWAQHGYADEVEFALMVMYAESQGVPTALNPTSDASGLFQHLPKFWEDRSTRAGWAGADIFDPEANIAVAAWLRATNHERGWYHWAPVWDRTPVGSFGPDTHWDAGRGWYADMGGGTLGSRASFTSPVRPFVELKKTAGDADARGVLQGIAFTWTFVVSNSGDIAVTDVELTDATLGDVHCPVADLAPGDVMTCTARDIAQSGPSGGSATVTARGAGIEVTAQATGFAQGIPDAGLEMRVASLPDRTLVRFKNIGKTDLYALGVWVEEIGAQTCPDRDLKPGEITVCTLAATAEIGDAWAFTNTGVRAAITRP